MNDMMAEKLAGNAVERKALRQNGSFRRMGISMLMK